MSPMHHGQEKPIYHQIARVLQSEIARAYRAGDMLPSESALAENFGVNRHTLRRAVDELVDAGIVERRRGYGTQVLDPAICYPISTRTQFTENINAQGHSAEVKVLFNRIDSATKDVSHALHIEEGSNVVWIEILRLADHTPFSVSSHFFPASRFEKLVEIYSGKSLHAFLEKEYGFAPQRKVSYISAIMPQTADAHALRTPRNKPLIRIKSINIDPLSEHPVEYCVTRVRPDRCVIEVQP